MTRPSKTSAYAHATPPAPDARGPAPSRNWRSDIEEELKNALRSTPKGLETPKYLKLASVRRYQTLFWPIIFRQEF